MSLDLINHKLTTSTTDENGVITWSNPIVDVQINSNGKVIRKGKEMVCKGKELKYNLLMTLDGGGVKRHSATFNGLFSTMVLGKKLGTETLTLKNKTKGYIESNVEIIHTSKLRIKAFNARRNKARSLYKSGLTTRELSNLFNVTAHTIRTWVKESEGTNKQGNQPTPKQLVLEPTQEDISMDINTSKTKQFYTVYEAKNEHITEDGAVFPTLELAQWHQEKVSKGKGNAQVVLDYNGGYVLAEQIYLQEVVYNKATPYTNFVDVLNNNQGIVSNVQEEHYKFDKLEGEGLGALFMFGLNDLNNLVCSTKTQAEKINTYVNQYSKAYKELDESVVGIKKLISLVK